MPVLANATVEELALNAGVPVWNGLTDTCNPPRKLTAVKSETFF